MHAGEPESSQYPKQVIVCSNDQNVTQLAYGNRSFLSRLERSDGNSIGNLSFRTPSLPLASPTPSWIIPEKKQYHSAWLTWPLQTAPLYPDWGPSVSPSAYSPHCGGVTLSARVGPVRSVQEMAHDLTWSASVRVK